MKLGIIRRMQTEDYCPGSRDFRTIRERKGAFMGEDDIQLVGFINCGGCPGKKAVLRARSLVEQGADTIAFASCISKGTPIGYSCPFAKRMRELVQKEVSISWITPMTLVLNQKPLRSKVSFPSGL